MASERVGGALALSCRDLESGARRLHKAWLKRALDIIAGLVGLMFLAPFFALVSILIFIDNPGPVLFRQRRTGYNGVPFVIYKFRTMYVFEDGPSVLAAVRNDARTTRLGRFLRRSSIDELPQLLNVLKGDMSLVGPRPLALAHDEYYARTVPDYWQRFQARPGITGLAQISGIRGGLADAERMFDRLAHDLNYIQNWSIMLDIQILLRTVLIVPFDPHAY